MASDLDYDPYDREIDADPYPTYRRLRDEAPLYRNEAYDFYAVSRFDDVQRGLVDRETYSSARGAVLEFIQADIEIPPGVVIFEDPPQHTVHRGLLSRVFTPKKMEALEPKVREFCARALDPLVGAGGFDFVGDLGAQMPMRTIGMLLGVPEADQEAARDRADAALRTDPGQPMPTDREIGQGDFFDDYVDWREEHPADDLMTELIFAEFEDEDGERRTLTREEVLTYTTVLAGAGIETTGRLIGWLAKLLA
ncbi:MAG: cytochrome P450, partial [Acidimicrobiales bacterium]